MIMSLHGFEIGIQFYEPDYYYNPALFSQAIASPNLYSKSDD